MSAGSLPQQLPSGGLPGPGTPAPVSAPPSTPPPPSAPAPAPAPPYAPPRSVTDLGACFFYHSMDLPGFGEVTGEWDLRPGVADYLGRVDFAGKRVLELGTADGFLTFEIEKAGGEVVSYDLDSARSLDLVPFARRRGSPVGSSGVDFAELIPRMNDAYWLAHAALESSARIVYGDVYSVPDAIGPVDVAVFGTILLHTRDPFAALARSLPMVRETVVVTEDHGRFLLPEVLGRLRQRLPRALRRPGMRFIPDWRTSTEPEGWWRLSPELLQAFLGVLGFEASVVIRHAQLYRGAPRQMFTVVAHRTVAGEPGERTGREHG